MKVIVKCYDYLAVKHDVMEFLCNLCGYHRMDYK